MAQNSKHFIFVTIRCTKNADRVWQVGCSLLREMWGLTEMILTAEAGRPQMAFYSKFWSLADTPPGLSHQQGSLDFLYFSTRLKKERSGNVFLFHLFSLELFLLLLCEEKKIQITQNPDLHF